MCCRVGFGAGGAKEEIEQGSEGSPAALRKKDLMDHAKPIQDVRSCPRALWYLGKPPGEIGFSLLQG
jgi:hypothetical protein